MKDIAKAIIILTVIYLLLFFLVNTNRQSQDEQEKPETVYLTDTITQVMYDTIFIDHFETVKLPVVDTVTIINDSIRIDSVFVVLPISKYSVDTTFTTDTTSLNIRIQNSGYNVKLDSLSYSFTYRQTHQKSNFFKEHFKFGLGAGAGLGVFSKKPDIFVGVGLQYIF